MPTPFDDALAELDLRLAARGLRARICVHGGMTAIMVHRDGGTEATIDQALAEGPGVVGPIAAEIARQRGLPADWLSRLTKPVTVGDRLAAAQRLAMAAFLKCAARVASRCNAVAQRPDGSRLSKPLALLGIQCVGLALRALPRLSERYEASCRSR
ncbi:MAG: hypothetical protein F4190_02150 [Acidimicrobiales bacterium]|nr:hypothetical protein [Acidimicrobiales bacterium]MYI28056.1 hypothetical protein [Acidimicrobiales bacterium]